jgi:transketolase
LSHERIVYRVDPAQLSMREDIVETAPGLELANMAAGGRNPAWDDPASLHRIAQQVRGDVLRAVVSGSGGHVGGPLSAADMLVALYFRVMNIRPEDPIWEDRDRFIMSKGHSAVALYATMAARSYFPRDELMTFDKIDSRLQGHPDMTKLPGIDMSTGSLGQGFSAAIGMALGARLLGRNSMRVFCMLGDGECQEGSVWEGAFIAARYRLDNLIVLVDFNGLQQYGWPGSTVEERLPPWELEQFMAKWRAFGWQVEEVDGHSMPHLLDVLLRARANHGKGQPTCIVARTIKGKGVSFMERSFQWHAKVPSQAELEAALAELGRAEIDG